MRTMAKERIVYSTDVGQRCPNCLRAINQCVCRKGTPGKRGDGVVRVGRETQGRNGKAVTVISVASLAATRSASSPASSSSSGVTET